eukprot:scaffold1555_cov173-Amphora_coffeaeformis.AAC.5
MISTAMTEPLSEPKRSLNLWWDYHQTMDQSDSTWLGLRGGRRSKPFASNIYSQYCVMVERAKS